MKIAILTRRKTSSYYIVNNLNQQHDFQLIVEQPKTSNYINILRKRARRSVKKNGLVKGSWNFIFFLLEIPYLLFETNKLSRYLSKKFQEKDFLIKSNIHTFKSINDMEIVSVVNTFNPAVIIVLGTDIINEHIISGLKKAERFIINWHAGITPEYRGCKSELYCVINNELDMVGSTIHLLDKGIDTGKIIMQEKVQLNQSEKKYKNNYAYLRYKNIRLVVEMLNKFLEGIINKNQKPFSKKSSRSKLYSTPRLISYIKYYKIRVKTSFED